MQPRGMWRAMRRIGSFVLVLLGIEFLDELVYGAREAAWPLIRADLGLSYAQIGLLLGVPGIVGNIIEPLLGVLADVWRRRVLVLGGGIVFGLSLLLTAAAQGFALLLLAFILLAPASGAFVSLSQAALMDHAPTRREQNMARWTFAGSVGVLAGPLALGAFVLTGAGWRGFFMLFAALTGLLLALAWRFAFPRPADGPAPTELRNGLRCAMQALRRPSVVRWLVLLEFSDLMLDVLLGYLALYWVDVIEATPAAAGAAVALWSGVGLLGDLLLIPLLEEVRGLTYLRWSVWAELLLYPLFLLAPASWPKLALLALVGLGNAGWYSILKAQLYSAMPGQSGTALAVNNVSGIVGSLIPIALGAVAQRYGLGITMWLLWLGPIVLLLGLPRAAGSATDMTSAE